MIDLAQATDDAMGALRLAVEGYEHEEDWAAVESGFELVRAAVDAERREHAMLLTVADSFAAEISRLRGGQR